MSRQSILNRIVSIAIIHLSEQQKATEITYRGIFGISELIIPEVCEDIEKIVDNYETVLATL